MSENNQLETGRQPEPLIGESDAFLAVLEQASRAAPLDKPVLVIGERGTGKEQIAARLHFLSGRWSQAFVKLNCAAISEDLLDAELFGHEAGAFTGANRGRAGRFEVADGGTLFLDELASMSLRLQEKLLRVVEYGEFERVGSSRTMQVDVRLVGAANQDLPSLVEQGAFRPDLLDRLSFDVLTVPPLRARREDIALLAESFARAMARQLGRPYFAGFTPAAEQELMAHDWPGNVRELKNVVERAVYRLERAEQSVEGIELDPFASPFRPPSAIPDAEQVDPITSKHGSCADRSRNSEAGQTILPVDFAEQVAGLEQSLASAALEQAKFNQRRAAELLQLTYHQFRGLMRKYPELRAGLNRTSSTEPDR